MIRDTLRRLLGRSAKTPPSAPPRPAPASPPETNTNTNTNTDAPPSPLDPALVEAVIDERIRPALRADGGDIELVEIRGADIHVRLKGACRGCPGASMTLKMGVEALLRDEIPGFGRVVDLG
jgi:Fe-S cluster biogenesis protein NfuA